MKNNIIRREIKLCGRRRKRSQHVLYPGFGMGQLLGLFAQQPNKYTVTAIDKDCNMVVQSSNYFLEEHINNIYCRTTDVLELNDHEVYDLSLAINLLNYVEDDHRALVNLYESLKKPGILIIFNSSNYADDKASKLNIGVYKDKKYRNGYGILELKHMLKGIGFSKVKARYVYGTPGILSWKITTAWPSSMIKASRLSFVILPIYTLISIPFVFILNLLDINFKHKKGKCIVVKAFKQG
ncbi:MAG: class I SAM-dependent methyltransferase [Bacteroidia bacterium]|nr:class I SAM-dependent methyltransferase [Bacteroidia bacterium]